MPSVAENNIAQAVARLDRAQHELNDLLRAECTQDHEMRQHRDKRLPWCETCRRDLRGTPVPREQPTN